MLHTKSTIDFYYWYFATMAMSHKRGEYWQPWRSAVTTVLSQNQKKSGCAKGSWPPSDAWSENGGRVYATAINLLTLMICYRGSN